MQPAKEHFTIPDMASLDDMAILTPTVKIPRNKSEQLLFPHTCAISCYPA